MKRNGDRSTSRVVRKASTEDDIYCHLIARRAVVRAALYLGIDCMSQEALDTLSGVLLEYLARIGTTLAMSVEASGRSSAHCNAVDALRVVELLTPPCCPITVNVNSGTSLTGTGPPLSAEEGAAAVSDGYHNNNHQPDEDECNHQYHPESCTTWKDLASFCFGPRWRELSSTRSHTRQPQSNSTLEGSDTRRTSTMKNGYVANGGREKPDSNNAMNGRGKQAGIGADTFSIDGVGVMQSGQQTYTSGFGWNAPYPDEIPAFPICRATIANPHSLPEQSFHSFPTHISRLYQDREDLFNTASPKATQSGLEGENSETIGTLLPQQALADSLHNLHNSLVDLPDDVFTTDRRYEWDFFAQPSAHAIGTSINSNETATNVSTSTSTNNANISTPLMSIHSTSGNTSGVGTVNDGKDKKDDLSLAEPAKKKVKLTVNSTNGPSPNKSSDPRPGILKRLSMYDAVQNVVLSPSDPTDRQSSVSATARYLAEFDTIDHPLYVPKFFPPFPPPRARVAWTFVDMLDTRYNKPAPSTGGVADDNDELDSKPAAKNFVESGSALIDTDTTRTVRSALVRLGKQNEHSVWGSYQWTTISGTTARAARRNDEEYENERNELNNSNNNGVARGQDPTTLVVSARRTEDGSSTGPPTAAIVPLNRASGSRVSRILEGSMDAAAL